MDKQISKNFRLSEFGLSVNSPARFRTNVINLVTFLLQPLRDFWKLPVFIGSGWRSVKHNHDVGGVPDSQHLTGNAADIKIHGVTPPVLAQSIRDNFDYDVLILYEPGYPGYPNGGVHVSFVEGSNRKLFKIKKWRAKQ